jgi:predicted amidophosphoribosyltransferase
LDSDARFHNVQDAFHADSQELNNQNVILVDDLVTTGATMVACTRALMAAGVQRVFGISVARA